MKQMIFFSLQMIVFNSLSIIAIGQVLDQKKNIFTWKRNKRVIVLSLFLIYYFYKTFTMYWIAYGWLSAFTNISCFYTVPFYIYLLQLATNYNQTRLCFPKYLIGPPWYLLFNWPFFTSVTRVGAVLSLIISFFAKFWRFLYR